MAFYCIDYNNGSNVTGDGTALAPWQTIEHGNAQINGGAGYISGDEMRIAGSSVGSDLATNFTATPTGSGYVRLNVGVDLTGSLIVGDYVRVTNNQYYPSPVIDKFSWAIKAITSTYIDIYLRNSQTALFKGTAPASPGGSLAQPRFSLQKISDFVTFSVNGNSGYYLDQPNTISNNFENYEDAVIISGGWDPANFTSKTNLGKTVIGRIGTYQSTSTFDYGGAFRSTIGFSGLKFEDINTVRVYLTDYQTSGVWNSGWNLSGCAAGGLIDRITGTVPTSFLYPRVFDNISITQNAISTITSSNLTVKFDNSTIESAQSASTSPIANPFTSGSINNEFISLSGNTILMAYTDTDMIPLYTTTANPSIANTYIPYDLTTTTVLFGTPLGSSMLASQNTSANNLPVAGYSLTIPSSFASGFNAITTRAIGASYGYNVDYLDALPRWHDETVIVQMGAKASTITETSSGITYNFSPGMYTRLNTIDNATGSNCIEFRPSVVKNAATGKISGNWMPIVAERGQVINVTISAKILGATSGLTPTLQLQSTDSKATSSYIANNTASSFGFALNNFTLIGGSLNNSTYTDLTYQVTVLDGITNTYQQFSLQWDIPSLPSGDRLLVDQVTYTIS
jgi:hypothetical protein